MPTLHTILGLSFQTRHVVADRQVNGTSVVLGSVATHSIPPLRRIFVIRTDHAQRKDSSIHQQQRRAGRTFAERSPRENAARCTATEERLEMLFAERSEAPTTATRRRMETPRINRVAQSLPLTSLLVLTASLLATGENVDDDPRALFCDRVNNNPEFLSFLTLFLRTQN